MTYTKPEVRRQQLVGLMDHPSGLQILCKEGYEFDGHQCVEVSD